MVKSDCGKGVDIDEEGRYRVRFDFYPGKDEYPRGYASPPLVLVQPYGNSLQANHPRAVGYHFPLHDGTYVYAQFLDGNLDRPIIGGTLYSPQQSSSCAHLNPWQNQYHL